MEAEIKAMKNFLQEHTFYTIMTENASFKDDGGSCIDVLITNSKFSFMKINSFETGLSDHHHMIYTILKTKLKKNEPKKLIDCNLKQFDCDQFELDICNSMSAARSHVSFEDNFVSSLDKESFYKGIKNPILIRTFRSK